MKKRIFTLLLAALMLVGALAGCSKPEPSEPSSGGQPPRGELYILMYHSVAPDGTNCGDWTITVGKFREHMQWLKDNGYTTVLPSELLAGQPLPEKAVMLTFDDGYTDNYTNALPVLQEFGHKAVVSVVTSYLDVEDGFMTWDQCRALQDSGLVEIGSHTHNLHRYPGLKRQDGETQEDYEKRAFPDLDLSMEILERELGKKPVFLAYPHGIEDPWIRDYARGKFLMTVVTDVGVNDISDGWHGMLRWNINDRTDLSKYLP